MALLALTVMLVCVNAEMGRQAARRWSAWLEPAGRELLTPEDPSLLGRLYPNTGLLRQYARILRARGLSVYRRDETARGAGVPPG